MEGAVPFFPPILSFLTRMPSDGCTESRDAASPTKEGQASTQAARKARQDEKRPQWPNRSTPPHSIALLAAQCEITPPPLSQKFRKGVGGQRGLAQRNPSKARDLGLFSVPFFLCPLRRMVTHFWRTFWALFGGFQTPPANPFSKPLTIAQYFFEIVSQRGMSHPFALFSWGIAPVSLRYPLGGGGGVYRTSTSHALHGGSAQKRGRGYRTQLAMLRRGYR